MRVGRVLLTVIALSSVDAPSHGAGAAPPEHPAGAWTEHEILASRPLPMQEITGFPELGSERPRTAISFGRGGSRASAPRHPRPANRARYLADPARLRAAWRQPRRSRDSAPWLNRGPAGFDFSSSRLIPEDAGTHYPYSTVGALFFNRPGVGGFRCSASVVSKRLIATAGHCAYNGEAGASTDFLFVPAFHDGLAPFGTWSGVVAFVAKDWLADPQVPNPGDFAIIVLADSDGLKVGDVTGWLGYKTGTLENNLVKMLAYPANLDNGLKMHQVDSGDWFFREDSGTVIYGSDMSGGSSGGPWVQNFGVKAEGQSFGLNKAENRIVGIASSVFSDETLLQSSSVLGSSFKKIFKQACAQASGNCAKKGKPNN